MNLREVIEHEKLEGTYTEIADQINYEPMVQNPAVQEEIIDSPDMAALNGLVALQPTAEADLGVIAAIAALIEAGDEIADYTGLTNKGKAEALLPLMGAYGMSAGSLAAIEERLLKTVPDPSWQAEIRGESLSEKYKLGRVTASEVMRAKA